ncbi:MAG TPA: hypothetical protein PLY93_10795, partial [Turneriella sp.]|nr:hypothetical protein [Turneriella sp.]
VGKVNTAYKALHDYFSEKENTAPSLQEVFDAVCAIRRSKLPNPREIGNAGSFFKNPIVDLEKYKALKEKYPTLPRFTVGINSIKIPAAWLIENLGYKGTTRADANGAKYGVHAKQPLVLVNYGGASGAAILSLAHEIQERVQEKFDIGLEMEVNII